MGRGQRGTYDEMDYARVLADEDNACIAMFFASTVTPAGDPFAVSHGRQVRRTPRSVRRGRARLLCMPHATGGGQPHRQHAQGGQCTTTAAWVRVGDVPSFHMPFSLTLRPSEAFHRTHGSRTWAAVSETVPPVWGTRFSPVRPTAHRGAGPHLLGGEHPASEPHLPPGRL
jgi:hypothetical protein